VQNNEFTVIDPITVLPEDSVVVDGAYACSKPSLAAEAKEDESKHTEMAEREKHQKPPMAQPAAASKSGTKSKKKKVSKNDLKKEVDMVSCSRSVDLFYFNVSLR